MLQFIFGLPHSGKTETILEKVKELAFSNNKSVIIVPEQSSFETEKAVYKKIGDSFSLNVEVMTFSRLYDEVCRFAGGNSARPLRDCDKIIFMSKALKQVSDELLLWGKYAKSLSFAQKMLDTVGEFKINGITPQQIRDAVLGADSASLCDKLSDIALIYETYDLLTAERFIDPADILTKLYYKLENYSYFKNKTVFIDGFKGFTGQQFKIIDRILTQSNDLYVSLTNDVSSVREFDVFTNIRTAVSKIENIASSHAVSVLPPIVLENSFYESDSLFAVERLISDNPSSDSSGDSVFVCKAKTIFDEAEFTARTIRRLVRTSDLRFRDFAIIVRDSEKYSMAVEYACRKNGVECFFDKKIPLLSFPISISVLSAINALNFSTENILRFHKSGIGILSVDEISALENYAYLWNINGDMWLNEWDMDVRGFVTDLPDDNSIEELRKINSLRKLAIAPIIDFKKAFHTDAQNMAKAIVDLLEKCSADKTYIELCKKYDGEELFSSDALKQSYESFMSVLDGIVTCFAQNSITKSDFYDSLYLGLSLEEIGIVPQAVDQVIFGQADRIRPSGAKVVFILGANQGEFPKFSHSNSIFGIKDRKKMIELGIEIEDNEIYSAIDENYLVYCNLSSPSRTLYITYATQTLKGEELNPSSFVGSICDNLNPKVFVEPANEFSSDNYPETPDAAFSEYCRRFHIISQANDIKNTLKSTGFTRLTDNVISDLHQEKNSISKHNAEKLYGCTLNMSATRFDTFNRCSFSYFCKYGLRLKRIEPVDFSVLQRGTIVHYVLQRIIETHKETIKDMTYEQLDALCDLYINEYLDTVIGFRSIQTARHTFLISKIARSLKETVHHISEEFAQSDFVPTHCELKIGGKDGIPVKFDYDGGEVHLNGSIDRVDEYNGYIRIVDYKTGSKSFKLPDILFGLNLQMLIYLYAVIRGNNIDDSMAAGICYLNSKRDLDGKGHTMNGLLKADLDLVKAMEKENRGEYIPQLSINKDGSFSKNTTSYISSDEFSKIFDHIEKMMSNTASSITSGNIEINPTHGRESNACAYCDFKNVCAIENKEAFQVPNLKNSEVFDILRKEE